MAAEQAIPLANDREVRVLQTKTVPQGISAMLAFDESLNAEDNHMAMMEMASMVETGQVTFAARDSEVDGKPIKQGQIMGMCNGKINYIGDDKEEIAYKTAHKLIDRNIHSIVTVIYGENVTEDDAAIVEEKIKAKYGSDIEVSLVNGGQPIYYYIISVE